MDNDESSLNFMLVGLLIMVLAAGVFFGYLFWPGKNDEE